MDKFVVSGGKRLHGEISISGAKNAALKTLVAACLTDEEVTIQNIPLISDFFCMVDIMKYLGAKVTIKDHIAKIQMKKFIHHSIPLDKAALVRASAMFIGPLLARIGEANIPNPGGCRLGARPIDRTIKAISKMNVDIAYNSEDGYFHAKVKKNKNSSGLSAIEYTFEKSTHTGTETMILAGVLATGKTILKNAAEEPEIDELIELLNIMGAKIRRSGFREITIEGVERLHGGKISINPDRNEIVTFAIAAILTNGDIFVKDAHKVDLHSFLHALDKAGGGYEITENGIRFFAKGTLFAVDITTSIYPGFMTDWQAPWAVLMTQASGTSHIHETVFENKLGYIYDLRRMGAHIDFFNPKVDNPEKVYNFNLSDDKPEYFHAVKIYGPTKLHDAVLTTIDIRAGAAVVLAALAAKGKSIIFGIEKLDRGYEKFEKRLKSLGANIRRIRN